MAKVSVLVPVYNVSAYIERCARSLFEQTFDDIEYIFVNDATPDDSMERLEAVIRQYPEREVRIVSHERNRGQATARHTALLAASGEYVCCVDSDDYIDWDMVASLYTKAVEEGADIVVSDAWFEYEGQTVVSDFQVADSPEANFALMRQFARLFKCMNIGKIVFRGWPFHIYLFTLQSKLLLPK